MKVMSDTEQQPARNPEERLKALLFMDEHRTKNRLWVQKALDELLSEHLLPFKLTAYAVHGEGRDYVVSFHDSRLHSIRFCGPDDRSFKEAVRAAVLESVERMADGQSTKARSYYRSLSLAS
jgi:hypothetical protein